MKAFLGLIASLSSVVAVAQGNSYIKVSNCRLVDSVNPSSGTYADIFLSNEIPEGYIVIGSKKDRNYGLVPVTFQALPDFSTITISKESKWSFVLHKGKNVPVEQITGASFVLNGSVCTSSWGE
jgi:hypothetical protein